MMRMTSKQDDVESISDYIYIYADCNLRPISADVTEEHDVSYRN